MLFSFPEKLPGILDTASAVQGGAQGESVRVQELVLFFVRFGDDFAAVGSVLVADHHIGEVGQASEGLDVAFPGQGQDAANLLPVVPGLRR